MKHLRQSGRTTRLIEEAKSLLLIGKYVTIIADNPRSAGIIRCQIASSRIEVKTVRELPGFDLATMTMKSPGYTSDRVFLVDHYVIEDRFAALLEMLHRFDPPEPEFKSEIMAEWGKKP